MPQALLIIMWVMSIFSTRNPRFCYSVIVSLPTNFRAQTTTSTGDNCPRPTDLKCPACNKEGHCVFDWHCQLNPSHWKYTGIQRAKKASQRGQTVVAATQSRTTPTGGECNTSVEASQRQEHQKQARVIEIADEREVDMADVAETPTSDE